MYCSQKLGEDFAKFCGLLRIYELYYGNMGCQVFKGGIQNQLDFCPKNPYPQRKLLYFVNSHSGDFSKIAKIGFSLSKINGIFLVSIEEFLTTSHYVNSQITIVSFKDIKCWPKIYYPILYPICRVRSCVSSPIQCCTPILDWSE